MYIVVGHHHQAPLRWREVTARYFILNRLNKGHNDIMPAIPPDAWSKMCSAFTVRTDWLFYPQSGYPGCRQAVEAVFVRGLLWYWRPMACEASGPDNLNDNNGNTCKVTQLHIKVFMEILMSLMVAGDSLSDVCLSVEGPRSKVV